MPVLNPVFSDHMPAIGDNAPEPLEGVVTRETLDLSEVEDVQELIRAGADSIREGVKQLLEVDRLSQRVARILFLIRTRISAKDGYPDLNGSTKASKDAAKELYRAAGENMTGDREDIERAVRRLTRAAQYQMSQVRLDYVRSLPTRPEELKRFRGIEGLKDDPVLAVRRHYDLPEKSFTEIARERKAQQTGKLTATATGLAALEQVGSVVQEMTERAEDLSSEEREDLRRRINELVVVLVQQAGKL